MKAYSFIDQQKLKKELAELGLKITQASRDLALLRAEARKLKSFIKEELQNEKS